jgi:hypothetical protein
MWGASQPNLSHVFRHIIMSEQTKVGKQICVQAFLK